MGVRLPAEYQEAEYLESTGTQYINTLSPVEELDVFEIAFVPLRPDLTQRYFGAMDDGHGLAVGSNGNTYMCAINNAWRYTFPRVVSEYTLISYDADARWVINSTAYPYTDTVNAYAGTVVLFAVNYNDRIYTPATMRLYSYKQSSHNGVLKRNMIPCYRKYDDKPGMYDLVSGMFFVNQGTGEFVVGPDVTDSISSWLVARRRVMLAAGKRSRLPREYQEVEWLESTGAAYINSGIECTSDLIVTFKAQLFDNNINAAICGGIDVNGPPYFRHHCSPNRESFYWIQYDSAILAAITKETYYMPDHLIEIYVNPVSGVATVEGIQTTFPPLSANYTTGRPYGIFARIASNGSVQSKKSRFKTCEFIRNSQIIGDFITCRRKSDNKPGMYDLCGSICPLTNSPFYINAGTGEFLVGPDVN